MKTDRSTACEERCVTDRASQALSLSRQGVRTVSFHNFESRNFKSSVSNPKSKHVAYLSVLSQISNCQSLGRKHKHEILKTDRSRQGVRMHASVALHVLVYACMPANRQESQRVEPRAKHLIHALYPPHRYERRKYVVILEKCACEQEWVKVMHNTIKRNKLYNIHININMSYTTHIISQTNQHVAKVVSPLPASVRYIA